MRVVTKEIQQKSRRKAAKPLLVYDLHTGMPMGQIIDMSERGMKIASELPFKIRQIYYCRMPLMKIIKGFTEVYFDAECRWCQRNEETSWYDSGYILRFSAPHNAELVHELIHSWMVERVERLNADYLEQDDEDSFIRRLLKSIRK
jgi:hypothetical protein